MSQFPPPHQLIMEYCSRCQEVNVKASSLWRLPPTDAPSVKPSQDIGVNSIEICGSGDFKVQGTRKEPYEVVLGCRDAIPSWWSPALKKHGVVRKHMMAVLHHGMWDWDKLPPPFLTSVFLNLDKRVLEDEHPVVVSGEESDAIGDGPSQTPVPMLDRPAMEVRAHLNQLRNLIYTVVSIPVLHDIAGKLKELQLLLQEHQTEDATMGLPMEADPSLLHKAEDPVPSSGSVKEVQRNLETHVKRQRRRRRKAARRG